MKYKLIFIGLLLQLVTDSCKNAKEDNNINGTRNLTILFDPSHDATIEKYPVKATLDGVKILDTLVKNTHINSSLPLTCTSVDTGNKNIFELTVLGKTTKVQLNNYHSYCLSVFSYYDNTTIIRKMFDNYTANSIKTTGIIPDYKHYLISIRATHPGDKFDSLYVQVKRDVCLCDSD